MDVRYLIGAYAEVPKEHEQERYHEGHGDHTCLLYPHQLSGHHGDHREHQCPGCGTRCVEDEISGGAMGSIGCLSR